MTRAHLDRDGLSVRVSSFCTAGTCVGVGWQDGGVHVVDTKNLDGSSLSFSAEEWRTFVAGVKAGEFDRP